MLYSPHPRIPIDASSTSASASSASDLAAPPATPRKPKPPCIPLPSQLHHSQLHQNISPPKLHFVLDYQQQIQFDLFDRRECLRWCMKWESTLNQPATKPTLPSITLIVPFFPWPIIAHASTTLGGNPVVTVLDILNALYRGLWLPAAEDVVWEGLMENKRARTNSRCSTGWARIQRLEYLGGRRKFVGLSHSDVGGDIMNVHIE
ncbi:hypothetical protein AB1N83_005596 [Pleurotus pulmonarius]